MLLSAHKPHHVTIMGLGDSITEGGAAFTSYVYPLWEMLMQEGYTQCEMIGPRMSQCRIGTINHCGFSGKNVEFLNARLDSVYRAYLADIVLLHSGHNHFASEHPVPHMMTCYRQMEKTIHRINPKAVIIIAKVILSGKLPKYSYLPELNDSIGHWVATMHSKRLLLCDMTAGWDWRSMTISDHVHPNPIGARLMASRWMEQLRKVLKKETDVGDVSQCVYKTTPKARPLTLSIYRPATNSSEKRPCILYFFAGGWQQGTPLQFVRECSHYRKKGYVAISADYSIAQLDASSPRDAYRDVTDAWGWVSAHADSLGIDKNNISLAGSSAGATMALAISLDKQVEDKPTRLLLGYPVLSKVNASFFGLKKEQLSSRLTVPALLVFGDRDPMIDLAAISAFCQRQKEAAALDINLKIFKGCGHPVFHYRNLERKIYRRYIKVCDKFI